LKHDATITSNAAPLAN